jgi:[ribosomal protein S18]-alanine N-acetyltransferase
MKTPVTVRRARREDVPAIHAIAEQNPMSAHWPESEYLQVLENIAARRVLLVAETAGEVVGFVVSRMVDSEWELENIAVSLGRQRKGIGQVLMHVLIDVARHNDAEIIFLEVRESNSHARVLYERCGFQQTGTRSAYYSNPPEDAVLYRFLCKPETLKNG